jgi:MFS family permease
MLPGRRVALRAMSVPPDLPIRRNTALLSAALAANSGMLQLSAAVASLTLVAVLGVKGLLGLGPAIVLASGALAALPAGRAMDHFGRVPVLAAGFIVAGRARGARRGRRLERHCAAGARGGG